MNYFTEYLNLLSALDKKEKVKINIHFIISEPLRSYCIQINQDANKYDKGFIQLGYNKITYPHISLFMGYVDSYIMLEDTFQVVSDYSHSLLPFCYKPSNVYLVGVTPSAPQYLFTASAQDNYIKEIKTSIDSILQNHVLPLEWNMRDASPHITLGCYKTPSNSLKKYIDTISTIPSCVISQIGISLSGNKGVCLGTLKLFDLGKQEPIVDK